MRLVAIAVATVLGPPLAVADSAPPADPRATEAADDANLESNWPRSGTTFSVSLGAGMVLGDGVGRGPSASFRIGHVATHDTVITFELTGGSRLHEDGMNSPVYHDDDYSFLAGALTYVAPSLWLRGAVGATIYTHDDQLGLVPHGGLSALAGVGLDIVRLKSLVLGIETWGLLSLVTSKGAILDTGLALGLSYY